MAPDEGLGEAARTEERAVLRDVQLHRSLLPGRVLSFGFGARCSYFLTPEMGCLLPQLCHANCPLTLLNLSGRDGASVQWIFLIGFTSDLSYRDLRVSF